MKIKLRKAILNDLDEIQELFVETIKNTCYEDYSNDQIDVWTFSVKDKKKCKTIITNQYFLLATTDNKKVGYGSLENGN